MSALAACAIGVLEQNRRIPNKGPRTRRRAVGTTFDCAAVADRTRTGSLAGPAEELEENKRFLPHCQQSEENGAFCSRRIFTQAVGSVADRRTRRAR